MNDLMRRATRTASATPIGQDLIDFVGRADIKTKIKEAADRGVPPIMAVSDDLLASFPEEALADPMNKRRLGLLIAATMDELGYEPARSNVRIRNPLFVSGSTYRRKSAADAVQSDFIPRLVSILTEPEADRVISGIIARFPALKNKMRR
jgi:hypothetical protein